jgi:hypothetical protein
MGFRAFLFTWLPRTFHEDLPIVLGTYQNRKKTVKYPQGMWTEIA